MRRFGLGGPTRRLRSTPSSGTPAGARTVPLIAFRNDGLSGQTRATGTIPFPPSGTFRTTALDLAAASFWIDGVQVQGWIEADPGVHADAVGDPTDALIQAYAEVDVPFATLNTRPTVQLRFDAAPLPRLTKAGVTRFTNALPLDISASGTTLTLTGPFTWSYYADEDLRRHAGGVDGTWYALPGITTSVTPASNYSRFDIFLLLDASGNFRVQPYSNPTASASLANATFIPPQDDIAGAAQHPYQLIGNACIFVPAGLAFTLGVTDLRTPGIVVTTSGGTYTPYSTLPSRAPTASLVAADAAYLCASHFTGYELATEAEFRGTGAEWDELYDLLVLQADQLWKQEGAASACDSITGGLTQYASPLVNWLFFAQHGASGVRHYRRAVMYGQHLRDKQMPPGAAVWNAPGEPIADSAGHIVDGMLTGDRSTFPDVSKLLRACENNGAFLGRSTEADVYHNNTGRYAKHVIHGLAWAGRAGVEMATLAGGSAARTLSLNPSNSEAAGWLNADGTSTRDGVSLVTPTTNKLRFRRAYERTYSYMQPETAQPANAGLYYYMLQGYDGAFGASGQNTKGLGPWMQLFTFSEMRIGFATFGTPSDAQTLIGRCTEILFSGVAPISGAPIFDTDVPGAEALLYDSSRTNANSGQDLNGCGMGAIGWLRRVTGNPVWTTRGDTLALAIRTYAPWSTMAYAQQKRLSEFALHLMGWPKDRNG